MCAPTQAGCNQGVAEGRLTVGDAVLFITLMQQLYGPLNYFGSYCAPHSPRRHAGAAPSTTQAAAYISASLSAKGVCSVCDKMVPHGLTAVRVGKPLLIPDSVFQLRARVTAGRAVLLIANSELNQRACAQTEPSSSSSLTWRTHLTCSPRMPPSRCGVRRLLSRPETGMEALLHLHLGYLMILFQVVHMHILVIVNLLVA